MAAGLAYVVTLAVFVAADMAWLTTMADRVYRSTLGDIATPDIRLAPAIVFYVLYPAGLVFFAVVPALRSGSLATALLYGALFGFFTYATYDLTNQTTLRNWTTQLTIIDIAWGTSLAGATACVAFWTVSKLTG